MIVAALERVYVNGPEREERLVEALRRIRDDRCQCGGRFKWTGEQLRCEQCNRHEGRHHARAIARQALSDA